MIFAPHDTADGLKTGVQRTFNFFRGMHDQASDMVNPVKIYQAAHDFGQHEADIYIPDPDGHTENGDAYARKMGHDALDGLNPFNKKSAYEAGKSTLNAATAVVPGAVELDALKGLRAASTIADGEVITARAAAGAAAGTPEEAAAQAALRQAEARAGAARAAYRARVPGAEARKTADRARAAIRKARERRLDGARSSGDPLAPHTSESLAKAKAEKAKMHERWEQQTHGRSAKPGQPVLAHVSDAPNGNSTAAIGKPSGMMRMAGEGTEGGAIARKPVIKPTGEAKGKPTGTPEECERGANAEKKGKIARQNEAADALAYHGYKVEHKPEVLPNDHLNPERKPDYRIEGQIADCYTPTPGRTIDKIRNEISKKVKEGQANHIVLNLTDSPASVRDINRILTGHKEVTGSTYGPLSQVLGVRPKPGAQPIGVGGGVEVYAPQDMDVFQIYP